MENINTRLKRLTNQFSRISDQITAELEQIGLSSERSHIIKQRLQDGMQELITITQKVGIEATERKRIEKALEASNEELKDFIYITSHDFREPLRKISSFGSILQETLEGKIEPEDREYLGFMIDGAERMNQMIDDLLAYSRINTKTIVFEKVDLNDVVGRLETLDIGHVLEDIGAQIEIPQPLLNVEADPALVRQLFRNLTIHAIQHRKKETLLHIVIRTERIAKDEVKIEFQEHGVDIQTEEDKDIFKMSLQSHSREDYEEAGTGLAVCKKIIDRHGGRIGIESTADSNATFWFILPLSKQLEEKHTERLVNRKDALTLS